MHEEVSVFICNVNVFEVLFYNREFTRQLLNFKFAILFSYSSWSEIWLLEEKKYCKYCSAHQTYVDAMKKGDDGRPSYRSYENWCDGDNDDQSCQLLWGWWSVLNLIILSFSWTKIWCCAPHNIAKCIIPISKKMHTLSWIWSETKT